MQFVNNYNQTVDQHNDLVVRKQQTNQEYRPAFNQELQTLQAHLKQAAATESPSTTGAGPYSDLYKQVLKIEGFNPFTEILPLEANVKIFNALSPADRVNLCLAGKACNQLVKDFPAQIQARINAKYEIGLKNEINELIKSGMASGAIYFYVHNEQALPVVHGMKTERVEYRLYSVIQCTSIPFVPLPFPIKYYKTSQICQIFFYTLSDDSKSATNKNKITFYMKFKKSHNGITSLCFKHKCAPLSTENGSTQNLDGGLLQNRITLLQYLDAHTYPKL